MIEPTLADFLQEGLGLYVGSRSAQLEPNGARGLAAMIEPGGTHMVVYVAEPAAARILPDLDANGQVAVSFGRPRDDRACQVKGVFVEARAASPSERDLILKQWEGFVAGLEYIGIARPVTSGWMTWPAVAIRLKVTAVFEQTPGPAAGTALA